MSMVNKSNPMLFTHTTTKQYRSIFSYNIFIDVIYSVIIKFGTHDEIRINLNIDNNKF